MGGTDCGATHTPFDVLLDEIMAFTSQGLSNAEALRTVTSAGAEQLGFSRRGRVAAGYEADLVLLAADPLADLEALRRPARRTESGRGRLRGRRSDLPLTGQSRTDGARCGAALAGHPTPP